jgi:ribose transport system ATP-binding protein
MAVTAQGVEVLRLADVWKSFDGVDALKGVTFEARAGEIHALLGENGAGKSTLMAIAAGSLAPDRGEVELSGAPVRDATPTAVRQRGLSIAYQHPALVPDLTVYENIAMWLPRQVREAGKDAVSWMRAQLSRVGCRADLTQRVSGLSVAQRHLLEIAKAMASDPAVLILDEPTAALGADDSATLFAELRRLAASGVAVVYITHRLAEVRELCQQVTVLRDGSIRGTFAVGDITDPELLELIVGRAVTAEFPPKPARHETEPVAAEPVLAARGLSARAFHEVTLTAAAGEIVGLAGIVGNGQSEFLRALAGLGPASGRAELHGVPLKPGRPDAALDAGVVYLSADRLGEGLFGTLSVRENALVSTLGQFSRGGVTSLREESRAVEAQRANLSIRAPSIEANVLSLSGGNQQKVLLTRALLNQNVRLLLAEEPTQGVDVGARAEIYRLLREIADRGVPVVVGSSDTKELEGLCDRVLVMSRGHAVATLDGDDVTEEKIVHAAISSTQHAAEAAKRDRGASRLARFVEGDYAPVIILAIVMVALGAYILQRNHRYTSDFNITSVQFACAALGFISLGQTFALLLGGIDLSVGPLAGFLVVLASFFVLDGKSPATWALGFLLMFLAAAGIGLLNGALIRFARFTPVAATLVTYIGLGGLAFTLRSAPDGYIAASVTNAIQTKVGPVPVAFIAFIVIACALELGLRKSKLGLRLRAVGSSEESARRVGVPINRVALIGYLGASLLTLLGAVVLLAQIGVGDPGQGSGYTLTSITAVVLGGTSLLGGRGTFIGTLMGAGLSVQVLNATVFLSLDQKWQYIFQGLLIVAGAIIYSQVRRGAIRDHKAT